MDIKFDINSVKQAAKGLVPEVNLVLEKRAIAEVMREKIDSIHTQILLEEIFEDDEGNRITNPRYSFRIEKEPHQQYYYKRCDEENKKLGFDLPHGYCPALIAENELRKAEHALIKQAERYFPGLTKDKILCTSHGLDNLKKYLDMLCGLVVNTSGNKIKNRFKKSA